MYELRLKQLYFFARAMTVQGGIEVTLSSGIG